MTWDEWLEQYCDRIHEKGEKMGEVKIKAESYKQMEYKAALFDIIQEEMGCVGDDFGGFYGFVRGVTSAYDEWERNIYESK